MTASYIALDMEIPSDVSEIERVVGLVTDECRALHLPARICSLNIPVALSEALSNAIIRGNHEDPSKNVRLLTTVSDKSIVFEVADDGPGFDMDGMNADPRDAANIQREDGRGVFLMRKLMDRVEQQRSPRHVVRLTLNR